MGAAYLPPAESDIKDWPVSHGVILEHMRECLHNISCSEPIDALSEYFPALKSDSDEILRLTKVNKSCCKLLAVHRGQQGLRRKFLDKQD